MAQIPTGDPDVVDDRDRHRYEIRVGDELVGFVTYVRRGHGIEFLHEEIDDRFGGRGLGRRLVKAILDDARRHRDTVTPTCPFVAAYLRRHPEDLDLVDAAHVDALREAPPVD